MFRCKVTTSLEYGRIFQSNFNSFKNISRVFEFWMNDIHLITFDQFTDKQDCDMKNYLFHETTHLMYILYLLASWEDWYYDGLKEYMIVNDTQNKTFTSSVMNVKISDKGTHTQIFVFLKVHIPLFVQHIMNRWKSHLFMKANVIIHKCLWNYHIKNVWNIN